MTGNKIASGRIGLHRSYQSVGRSVGAVYRNYTSLRVHIVYRRHGKPNVSHGPSAIDVQAVADADGRRDEDTDQPGGAQAGAIGVVRRDQAGVRQAGRGREKRTDVGRRWPRGGHVIAARAGRRRLRAAIAEFRLFCRRGQHRRGRG